MSKKMELSKNTIVTSIKIPKTLGVKIIQAVIDDGYCMRGKNKWIIESIYSFLEMDNYQELVDIAGEIEVLDSVLSIRLSLQLSDRIDAAIINVRKNYPSLEGVKSNIIRAAILQRLLRHSTQVT
jgi:hypothetical protein